MLTAYGCKYSTTWLDKTSKRFNVALVAGSHFGNKDIVVIKVVKYCLGDAHFGIVAFWRCANLVLLFKHGGKDIFGGCFSVAPSNTYFYYLQFGKLFSSLFYIAFFDKILKREKKVVGQYYHKGSQQKDNCAI